MKSENRRSTIGKWDTSNDSSMIRSLSSLMPQRALSHDGKKHVATVPVRLRRMQGLDSLPKHEGNVSFWLERWSIELGHV